MFWPINDWNKLLVLCRVLDTHVKCYVYFTDVLRKGSQKCYWSMFNSMLVAKQCLDSLVDKVLDWGLEGWQFKPQCSHNRIIIAAERGP